MTEARRWKHSELTDLRQRLREKATVVEIAAAALRTPEAVLAVMNRLRLRVS